MHISETSDLHDGYHILNGNGSSGDNNSNNVVCSHTLSNDTLSNSSSSSTATTSSSSIESSSTTRAPSTIEQVTASRCITCISNGNNSTDNTNNMMMLANENMDIEPDHDAIALFGREFFLRPTSELEREAEAFHRRSMFHEARTIYEVLARRGIASPRTLFLFGRLLLGGLGGAYDRSRAYALFEESSKRGYLLGRCQQAICLSIGDGVAKNEEEAAKLFDLDALLAMADVSAGGDWQAQFVAGYGLQFGLGCEKNIELAKELYERASQQGHLVAMNNMYVDRASEPTNQSLSEHHHHHRHL